MDMMKSFPWRVSMKSKAKKRAPEIIFREGKPRAVILDIKDYQEMLERLEDLDDLKTLQQMRKRPLSFRTLDESLKENSARV
jgi:PHD/YefM family antitoxin component YafN of YafNO toxin-antitoxin module